MGTKVKTCTYAPLSRDGKVNGNFLPYNDKYVDAVRVWARGRGMCLGAGLLYRIACALSEKHAGYTINVAEKIAEYDARFAMVSRKSDAHAQFGNLTADEITELSKIEI